MLARLIPSAEKPAEELGAGFESSGSYHSLFFVKSKSQPPLQDSPASHHQSLPVLVDSLAKEVEKIKILQTRCESKLNKTITIVEKANFELISQELNKMAVGFRKVKELEFEITKIKDDLHQVLSKEHIGKAMIPQLDLKRHLTDQPTDTSELSGSETIIQTFRLRQSFAQTDLPGHSYSKKDSFRSDK